MKGRHLYAPTHQYAAAIAVAGVVVLAVTACSYSNAVNRVTKKSPGGAGGYGYNIAMVAHGSGR